MFFGIYGRLSFALCSASSAGGDIDIKEVENVMSSNASGEEKTNFFIQYLLSQREPLLNLVKTLAIALLFFIVGRKVVGLLVKMIDKWMRKRNIEEGAHKFVLSFAKMLFNILLIFIVAGILGVGTSSIVAMVGSAGLAIGLALQGSLSNLAGGMLILVLKPFVVGDYIIAQGQEGVVDSIDIFYTRIITSDNKVIVIPNGAISNANVTNTSCLEERMLALDFTVSYKAEISDVRRIVLELIEKDERVCRDRDRKVVVNGLDPANVKMQAKFWVKTRDYGDARADMLENIKAALASNKIDIS